MVAGKCDGFMTMLTCFWLR